MPPRLIRKGIVGAHLRRIAGVQDRRLDVLDRPRRMRLPRQCGDARHVRRGHRGTGDRRRPLPVPTPVETTAHARAGDVRLQAAVTGARAAGREAREALEVRVRDRSRASPWPAAVRRRGAAPSEAGVVGRSPDAEERDRDGERHAVSGFDVIGPSTGGRPVALLTIIDGRGAGLLAEDRLRHACARAAVDDGDRVRRDALPNDCTSQPSDSSPSACRTRRRDRRSWSGRRRSP